MLTYTKYLHKPNIKTHHIITYAKYYEHQILTYIKYLHTKISQNIKYLHILNTY